MKRNFLLLIMVLCSVSYSSGQRKETLNIALVADHSAGLDQSPLISLLEARLSQNENIRLLERARIDEILKEQQLSVAGLFERETAVKVGKLLRADAFVLLSVESRRKKDVEEAKLLRVRLAETAHGIRLFDSFEQLDETNLEDVVQRLLKKIEAGIAKLLLPIGQAIPVGIVDIHRVQLGERHKLLERVLPVLLSIRLNLEPEIMMLEREDLKILLDEKRLTDGKDAEFWSSAVLIGGYLQQKDGNLEMTLHLRQAEGSHIAVLNVPIEPNEPSSAIERAGTGIINQLQDSPPVAQWNPAKEAEQFAKQGLMLCAHGRHGEAVIPLETACALQSENLTFTTLLFENEWTSRYSVYTGSPLRTLGPSYYSDLELADLASRLVRQIRREYETTHSISNLSLWSKLLGTKSSSYSYFTCLASVSSEQVKKINRVNRRIWVETLDKAWRKQPPRRVAIRNTHRAHLPWIGYDDPNELITHLKRVYKEILFPPEMGGLIEDDRLRCSSCFHVLGESVLYRYPEELLAVQLLDSKNRICSLWNDYFDELFVSSDPIVRFYAYLSQTAWNYEMSMTRMPERKKMVLEYFHKAFNVLSSEEIKLNALVKKRFIHDLKMILPLILGNEEDRLIDILEHVLEPAIVEKDVGSLMAWNLGHGSLNISFLTLSPNSARRYYKLLERVAVILQNQTNRRKTEATLRLVRDCQTGIKVRYPQLGLPGIESDIDVVMLLRRKDWPDGLREDLSPLRTRLHGDKIWMVLGTWGRGHAHPDGTHTWPGVISLRVVDLIRESVCAKWQGEITFSDGVRLTAIVPGDDVVYVCTYGGGLLEFHRNFVGNREYLEKPRILTLDHHLPSLFIKDSIKDGNRLWIAYGGEKQESGLGLYDPKTKHWKSILCSTVKGETPWGTGHPYDISDLTLTWPDKLFFVLTRLTSPNLRRYEGFWQLNTETGEAKCIVPYMSRWAIPRISIEPMNKNYLCKMDDLLIEFDPYTEETFRIMGTISRKSARSGSLSSVDHQDHLFIPAASISKIPLGVYSFGNVDLSSCTIHNDELWARYGRDQIAILKRGDTFEETKIIPNNLLDGEPVERFISTPYGIIAIGRGTVGIIETE